MLYNNISSETMYDYYIYYNSQVVIKAYEFLNNEYKPFAINLRRTLCHYLENEYKLIFYPSMPGFIPPKCPLLPVCISTRNYLH